MLRRQYVLVISPDIGRWNKMSDHINHKQEGIMKEGREGGGEGARSVYAHN